MATKTLKVFTAVISAMVILFAPYNGTTTLIPRLTISASAASTTINSDTLQKYQKEWLNHPYVLKRGLKTNTSSTGKKAVSNLQVLLNYVMNEKLSIDSIFGPDTERVVRAFQKKYSLTNDGVVGNATFKKLISVARSKISSQNVSITFTGISTPSSIQEGEGQHLSGSIKSSVSISSVRAMIINSSNNQVALDREDTHISNQKSYTLKNSYLDTILTFGTLKAGTYKLKYVVKSGSTEKTYTTGTFTVKGKSPTNNDVEEFQKTVLRTWVKPVEASILPVYKGSGREFGSYRDNSRLHAGVDFVARNGTPVYAMQSGTVIEYIADFWAGTSSLAIKHSNGSVARYCEISTNLRVGDKVSQHQKIAVMKQNSYNYCSMLHLELFLGTSTGSLTNTSNPKCKYVSGNYKRRNDIIDPTFILNL